MPQPSGPLSKEQIDELIDNIKKLDATGVEIEKAKRAGIDVADAEATHKDLRGKLMKLKEVYAPNRSI